MFALWMISFLFLFGRLPCSAQEGAPRECLARCLVSWPATSISTRPVLLFPRGAGRDGMWNVPSCSHTLRGCARSPGAREHLHVTGPSCPPGASLQLQAAGASDRTYMIWYKHVDDSGVWWQPARGPGAAHRHAPLLGTPLSVAKYGAGRPRPKPSMFSPVSALYQSTATSCFGPLLLHSGRGALERRASC